MTLSDVLKAEEMKKILFLIPSLQGGGAEKALVDLVNSLDQSRYEITVQTILNQSEHAGLLREGIRYRSVIRSKNAFINRCLLSAIIRFIPAKRLYRCRVSDAYDTEVAFLEGISTKIIAAAKNETSRKLAWVHTDLMEFPDSIRQFKSFQENLAAYEQFDAVACVSQAVKERFLKRFGSACSDLRTVYNVVNDEEIRRLAQQKPDVERPDSEIPLLVSCGRLVRQKGFDRLIRIHRRLLDEGVNHRLWIIGEGPERAALEQLIAEYDLHHTAQLLGYRSNPYPLLRQASLFVCSSVAEGYSLVITEAVILGVPVISTDVAGAHEPAACQRCSIVTENREDALYDAIYQTLTNPEQLNRYREETKRKSAFFKTGALMQDVERFLGGGEE